MKGVLLNHIIGILWFEDELAYRRALATFTDSQNLPATFKEWNSLVEKEIDEIRHAGNIGLRVDFHPEAFISWCRARGFQANSQAREAFAEYAVLEYQKSGEGTVIK